MEPWFAGRAYLNAQIVRGVFQALLANPDRPWKSEIVEADGLRGLEQYAAAYGEFLETGPVNSELQF